jgi:hypothetical protein
MSQFGVSLLTRFKAGKPDNEGNPREVTTTRESRTGKASKSLERTGHIGKGIVRVRADQTNRTHDQYKDDGQHDGIFGDVLRVV